MKNMTEKPPRSFAAWKLVFLKDDKFFEVVFHTDERVPDNWIMVLLKDKYLNNLIHATKMLNAEIWVRILDLK